MNCKTLSQTDGVITTKHLKQILLLLSISRGLGGEDGVFKREVYSNIKNKCWLWMIMGITKIDIN